MFELNELIYALLVIGQRTLHLVADIGCLVFLFAVVQSSNPSTVLFSTLAISLAFAVVTHIVYDGYARSNTKLSGPLLWSLTLIASLSGQFSVAANRKLHRMGLFKLSTHYHWMLSEKVLEYLSVNLCPPESDRVVRMIDRNQLWISTIGPVGLIILLSLEFSWALSFGIVATALCVNFHCRALLLETEGKETEQGF